MLSAEMDFTRYRPYHHSEPGYPTLMNRIRCRLLDHSWRLDYFDHPNQTAHYICARCSKIVSAEMPPAFKTPDETIYQE